MVRFSTFREIHDHGVIKHRAFSFGDCFEGFDDASHLFDLAYADVFANFVARYATVTTVMTKGMDGDEVCFVAGEAADGSREFINGVSYHVGEASDESRNKNFRHSILLLGVAGIGAAVGVDFADFRDVFGDLIRHFRELDVSLYRRCDGVYMVTKFQLLIACECFSFEVFRFFVKFCGTVQVSCK